jgi:hypothetical protein
MVVLPDRPGARPRPDRAIGEDVFELREAALAPLARGEVRLRNIYLSLDPYMAAYMLGEHPLETPIEARVVSQVVASNNPALAEGDLAWGFFGWEDYTTLPASLRDRKGYAVLDNKIDPEAWPEGRPLSDAISVLGMPGLTAYVGVVDIGRVKAGETLFVSSAAGALGQVAGQIGKIKGARVVGSAGSEAKVAHVLSLGFDAAFNYKTAAGGIEAALREHCPDGIDVYFDNVGGETLDAVLLCLNEHARVPLCGMISTYGTATPHRIGNLFMTVRKRATLTGFTIYDHFPAKMPAYRAQMAAWLAAGEVGYQDVIVDGIENTGPAFADMLAGRHGIGKCVIRVGPDPFMGDQGATA